MTAVHAVESAISSITAAEALVEYGDGAQTARGFRAFLAAVAVLPFDEQAARVYARLPFKRASFDRLIAAPALAPGLILVTNNEADFTAMPGLIVENWTQ